MLFHIYYQHNKIYLEMMKVVYQEYHWDDKLPIPIIRIYITEYPLSYRTLIV